MDTTKIAIKHEVLCALERLGANPMLLAIVESWGETLTDAQVLEHLRSWNGGTFRWASITSVEGAKPVLTLVK